ncbi:MAG TPA: oxalate/formate MFS antiporter [Alphaproteobacteria bacterium]|nr:oxalate/formate MFS antiporter [Alphaproteobacteria bacterium]
MSQASASISRGSDRSRWLQLLVGILCMVMIANLQYGWTFFVNPLDQKYHWGRASIQVAFTLFVLFETWLVPIEGYLVDRFGPKIVVLVGGALAGLAWIINAYAASLTVLYVAQIIGGIGAGAVYGTCVGNALKWFPDKRGLAAGLTAAGFGMGSAFTVVPIQNMIKGSGYESAFLDFGIGQGIVVVLLAFLLFAPEPGEAPAPASAIIQQTRRQYQPLQILGEPVFWVMYVMFVLMAAGGLMATAQLAPIAKDFKVAETPVSLLWVTLPALTFAASLDRVLNGLTRPFFGWVSDHIGREITMFIAFGIEGIGILGLYFLGQHPIAFVLLSGVVFFAWGEIYSLFPTTCTDCFGAKFAAANAGLLYTAKGTASLLVPVANWLSPAGNWQTVFIAAAIFNLVAAAMALVVLKPMRRDLIAKSLAETALKAAK